MKKKRLLTLMGSICLTLVLVALLLPACAKEEAPVTPTPARPTPVAPTPALTPAAPAGFEWPRSLTIGTAGVGSSSHAPWCGIAPIMEESTGMKVRVVPTDVEALKPVRLFEKELDFVAQSSAEVEMAFCGIKGHSVKKRLPLRILWYGYDMGWGFCVRGDSELKSIYDIKKGGVRVVKSAHSPAMAMATEALLEGIGITEQDVVIVPAGSYPENVRSVVEGRGDVAYASPNAAITYEGESAPKGLRWLDLPFEDEQLWESILNYGPSRVPMVFSRGVKSSIGHKGYNSPYVLYVLAESDQELVYKLAKWLNENYDAYKDVHANAARMTLDLFRDFLDYNAMPVAEGTIRYLKEIGKWTTDDDEWNEAGIELNTKYIETWQAAVIEAKAKGIALDATNKDWLDLWDSYKKDLPRFKVRL